MFSPGPEPAIGGPVYHRALVSTHPLKLCDDDTKTRHVSTAAGIQSRLITQNIED
jgi:hypothetical protein